MFTASYALGHYHDPLVDNIWPPSGAFLVKCVDKGLVYGAGVFDDKCVLSTQSLPLMPT